MKKIFFAVIILVPLVVLSTFPRWTVDDAYIYYRYADNLAKHGQLNWNIGEPPVEGYTGVILPVLLAACIRLGVSPIDASHVIGIFSYWLGLFMFLLVLRKLKLGSVGQYAGVSLYVFTPILFTHAWSGLETMLFFGLMQAAMYVAVCMAERSDRRGIEAGGMLLFFVLGATRPEGLAFGGLLLLGVAIAKFLRDKRECVQFLLRAALWYGITVVWFFYWRFSYYGHMLPHTFYVKTQGGFSLSNIADLIRFLVRYFGAPAVWALLLCATHIDIWWKKIRNRDIAYDFQGLAVLLGGYAAFIVLLLVQFTHSHLSMNYAYRFYVPILPFVWLVLSFFTDMGARVWHEAKRHMPMAHRCIIAIAVCLAVYQIAFFIVKLKEEIRFAREEQAVLSAEHIAIGRFLRGAIPPSEWLSVYMDAGAIPYFSGLKTIDFGGLNDEYLSRPEVSMAQRREYMYAHNPAAMVFTSENKDSVEYGREVSDIMTDERFKKYVLAQAYLSPIPFSRDHGAYHEFLFLRKDLVR